MALSSKLGGAGFSTGAQLTGIGHQSAGQGFQMLNQSLQHLASLLHDSNEKEKQRKWQEKQQKKAEAKAKKEKTTGAIIGTVGGLALGGVTGGIAAGAVSGGLTAAQGALIGGGLGAATGGLTGYSSGNGGAAAVSGGQAGGSFVSSIPQLQATGQQVEMNTIRLQNAREEQELGNRTLGELYPAETGMGPVAPADGIPQPLRDLGLGAGSTMKEVNQRAKQAGLLADAQYKSAMAKAWSTLGSGGLSPVAEAAPKWNPSEATGASAEELSYSVAGSKNPFDLLSNTAYHLRRSPLTGSATMIIPGILDRALTSAGSSLSPEGYKEFEGIVKQYEPRFQSGTFPIGEQADFYRKMEELKKRYRIK